MSSCVILSITSTGIQVHFSSRFTRQYSFAMYTACIHGLYSTYAGSVCQEAVADTQEMENPNTQQNLNSVVFQCDKKRASRNRLFDYIRSCYCSFFFWYHRDQLFCRVPRNGLPEGFNLGLRFFLSGLPMMDFHPEVITAIFSSRAAAPPSRLTSSI